MVEPGKVTGYKVILKVILILVSDRGLGSGC